MDYTGSIVNDRGMPIEAANENIGDGEPTRQAKALPDVKDLMDILIQGNIGVKIKRVEAACEENGTTFSKLEQKFYEYRMHAGMEYDDEEALRRLTTKLGNNREQAIEALDILEFQECAGVMAVLMADERKAKNPQLSAVIQNCAAGIEYSLIDLGGIGPQQARVLVSRYKDVINDALGPQPDVNPGR